MLNLTIDYDIKYPLKLHIMEIQWWMNGKPINYIFPPSRPNETWLFDIIKFEIL